MPTPKRTPNAPQVNGPASMSIPQEVLDRLAADEAEIRAKQEAAAQAQAAIEAEALERLVKEQAENEARAQAERQAVQASMEAELARLKAENDSLKRQHSKSQAGALTLKISEKGALSVYGMGRFPVTLYREQWEKLFTAKADIEAYIVTHDSRLKRKGEEL